MTTVTVRRQVPAAPIDVWRRLIDVERLVIDDHTLDLVELDGNGDLHPGARAVVSRRHGLRLTTYDVRVIDELPGRMLCLGVTVGKESWLVEAHVRPDPAGGTELLVIAELDPAHTPHAVLRGLTRPLDLGLYHQVSDLIERWIGHAELVSTR
ncbi:MAG TPA: SRPBCC family protein [Egicoccus sp.]|nr:SRPBCC family protein [Egicoccus sp.]HSK25241.1 SRPBCC family protein [Egicoccus sp.]